MTKDFLPENGFIVLCHGANLGATNWLELAMGDLSQDKAGRIPKAIEIAISYGAQYIIWATGASEKDGKTEAVFTYDTAIENLPEIRNYLLGRQVIDNEVSVKDLERMMEVWGLFDKVSQNTTQEVSEAIKMAREHNCKVIVQVSSGTHIQRCFAEALMLNYALPAHQKMSFVPIEADTCYIDSTPADVVVSEPPHRGDNLKIWLPRLFRAFFRLSTWEKGRARAVIIDVCEVLKKYDIKVDPNSILAAD